MKRILTQHSRPRAHADIDAAPDGRVSDVREPTRNSDQNAKFHAICGDIAKSGMLWGGKRRSADQWKVLLVSGHAVATKEGADMLPGLEGEFRRQPEEDRNAREE